MEISEHRMTGDHVQKSLDTQTEKCIPVSNSNDQGSNREQLSPAETYGGMADEEELKRLLSLTTKRTVKEYQRMALLSNKLSFRSKHELDDNDVAEIEALLAQYTSLREESLQTISNRVQIMLIGLAAIGALVGGSLTINDPKASRLVIYAVFSVAIPIMCIFILLVWAGEAMRSARAGYFLVSDVEARINQKLGRFVMNWEAFLWTGKIDRDAMWGTSMAAFAVIGIVALAAPFFGMLLSGGSGVSLLCIDLVIAVPYILLIGAAIYLIPKMCRLKKKREVKAAFIFEQDSGGMKK